MISVVHYTMLRDLIEIQSSKNQTSDFSEKYNNKDEPKNEKNSDNHFGLKTQETDQKIFLYNNVSTMFWLKSHHLITI